MSQPLVPAWRGASRVEELDAVGLLHEMIDRLVTDFEFDPVQLEGKAHINRTTEPVVRFLVWLERTPEAQDALRFAFRRLAARPTPR